ncbi:MAG: sulfotransferase [Planctomyces sp.]|nr:sulfotransferase [Planctomyces sp.]
MPPQIAPSRNFKNPAGLLWRMLLSGKRAAYSALAHEAMRILARPLDSLLCRREQRLLGRHEDRLIHPNSETESDVPWPVILVVGAPRSGTTLVYQTLARYLDVTSFSNLTSMFPKSPLTGTHLMRWLPGGREADFENYYGQTAGLHGPNDGFQIWNRWLGENRYIPRTDLSVSEQRDMRKFFSAWCRRFGKPFLNKNNRNTSCLSLLSEILPNAQMVVVRRNPIYVAQSLIKARADVQGDKSVGWGLHSSDATSSDPLSYVDDVCDQILLIEKELDEQLELISQDRIVEITYEGFCEDPHSALQFICRSIPGVKLKQNLMETELKPFTVSSGKSLTSAERDRLLTRLAAKRPTPV